MEFVDKIKLLRQNLQEQTGEIRKKTLEQIAMLEIECYRDWLGAVNSLIESGNRDKIMETGNSAFMDKDFLAAAYAFAHLRDKDNLIKCFEGGRLKWASDPSNISSDIAHRYFGENATDKYCKLFYEWSNKKGYPLNVGRISANGLLVANALADKYDFGVAVANQGLYLGFMFNLLGLDVKVVESHSRNERREIMEEATFSTQEDLSYVTGKRVIVIENDAVSGKTLQRVTRELEKYKPQRMDVSFNYDPVRDGRSIGTIVSSIPKTFGRAYFSEEFSFVRHFPIAADKLEAALDAQAI